MTEPGDDPVHAARDAIRYRRVLCGSLALTLMLFAVGGAVQSLLLQLNSTQVPIAPRLVANLVGVAVVVAAMWFTPARRLYWPRGLVLVAGVSLLATLVRGALHVVLGVHRLDQPGPLLLDAAATASTTGFAVLGALTIANYQQALIVRTRAGAHHAQLAAAALEALRAEELRVRRQVAEGLHGTVQQQLVILDAELQKAGRALAPDDPGQADAAGRIEWVRGGLDRLREHDIRDLSRLLYPSGLDLGLAQAGRILIRQIPSSIEVTASIDESVIAADDPVSGGIALDRRLLALRVLEEAVSNAIRHGRAEHLDISLRVDGSVLHLVVDDDGAGLVAPDGDSHQESGLRLLRESLRQRGGGLELGSGSLGGARLVALVPLAD